MNANRPSVSRDTRLLLAIVLVSIAMLWVLARVRFPDRVPTPNPVPPVLAQLTTPSPFDDIAASVAQLQPRLEPLIAPVEVQPARRAGITAWPRTVSALRFRDDLAVVLISGAVNDDPSSARVIGASEVVRDTASQLAVVKLSTGTAPLLSTWTPRRLASPRVMIAAAAWRDSVAFRPVFIGSLQSTPSAMWAGPVWTLPPPADLDPGTFVFTIDGAFAGLAVGRGAQHALVPADTILSLADRLTRETVKPRGRLSIDVEPLTPALVAATGANSGVIVTWVDPAGPAAGLVNVSDVIERAGDQRITTIEDWQALTARLAANESIALGVRHQNEGREVRLTAGANIAPAPPSPDRSPGITLRTVAKIGAAITAVDPDSPAARAGLQPGDVVTLVGGVQAPTAGQALRALAAAVRERPIVIGFTRAGAHHLVALERTW